MKEAFETIKQLVADFKAQESAYLSPTYQESQIRQDFIDKFFTALGWDVAHNIQKNPYQQEAHIENKVHMAGSQRKADYAFFLSPNFRDPKFFVEAKKPSRNLANPDDYYQTIRYGWNANTPIAVLTDFEEFHILDCRYKPNIKDVMSQKIEYFHYSDYTIEEKFSRIYWLFSREAVASGSIEKRLAELPKPRGKAIQRGLFKSGYQPVDEAFLEELDAYREILAKAFKKSNPDLQSEELTEAVQRTIDRLVFIRFLEDKQIEEPEIINLRSKKSAWKGFLALCKQLEPKYNGLVFKTHKLLDGKEFNPPDDEEFVHICDELADPSSPYNFDQIPISILGSIYERFLGKVVHATDQRVKVEEKPEVRKAGGVYYTPEYIVRYIVSETVGKLIEGKTPKEIAEMTFADIACGSGSFLIEVFNRLLDYHTHYYNANPDKQKEADVFERDGKLHLTLKKKKEILLNNVYGVDIDFQATEVTQLSLYLKMLEDVTMHDAHQFGMFKETILPDLRKNIINGNSVIGRDIIDGQLFSVIDENKLKPMNFEDAFPTVMNRGGFDAVVGNPPYVFGRDWKSLGIPEEVKKYFGSKYHWSPYQLDMFSIFMEKSFDTSKFGGRIGQIVPNVWLTNTYSTITRSSLLKHAVELIIAIPPKNVFEGITVDTIVYTYRKNKALGPKIRVVQIDTKSLKQISEFNSSDYLDGERPISTTKKLNQIDFIYRIKKENKPLSEFADITRGVHPYRLGGYGKSAFGKGSQTERDVEERPYHSSTKKKGWRAFIYGKDLARFTPLKAKEYVNYGEWLAEPRQSHFFEGERIYSRKILGDRLVVTIATDDNVADQQVYITKPRKENPRISYFAGILGSRLLSFYIRIYYNEANDAFPQIKVGQLQSLPIRTINFENAQEKSRHDAIVKLVEQMLDAKEKLSNAKTEAETNRFELLCQTLDRQIDEAVYELYGLTEEEIKIVEGK